MGIAGVDLLFGLSIFFLVGTDYEDCVIIYPPAIIAVLAGGLLFYGSLYYNKAATMVYLILSMMLIVFFGIASVILFTRFQKMATIIGSIFLFLGLLRTYFWCLVYIFFKSLKKPSLIIHEWGNSSKWESIYHRNVLFDQLMLMLFQVMFIRM